MRVSTATYQRPRGWRAGKSFASPNDVDKNFLQGSIAQWLSVTIANAQRSRRIATLNGKAHMALVIDRMVRVRGCGMGLR